MPTDTPESAKAKSSTQRHDPLLIVNVNLHQKQPKLQRMISVGALIDSGALAPVMSPELAEMLGWEKRGLPIRMIQADSTKLESHHFISTQFLIGNREF